MITMVAYIQSFLDPVDAKVGRRVLRQRPLFVASRSFNYRAEVSDRLVAHSVPFGVPLFGGVAICQKQV